ncbi:NADH-cytochrome b5 reductase 1 [Candidatus Velamenicoccus archaeovorus]|uniref:NADH-cytochrome b5 reductase 1 n=1 Tax=Velamenicoccus archaeovorus TaxID=1930593 RepID=A0A410P731_VELA1|nr:FAD-dependent oxidoreductase [Candidatus Velamenicoccus archaeovorus]QAT18017.1 NADH-cytochrome b5 reductase 1 [Candidatus Velamenicoccus archaeovorus]
MDNRQLELMEIVTQCCDVKTFRFSLEEDVPYEPGQYLVLTLTIAGRPVSKAFSISSSPTEKGFIQFTKKLSNSPFSRALESLQVGQACAVRFPMGKFTFTGQYPKAAFLIGGIGITPVRSIFKYATDMKLPSSLVLLYSSRTPEYLIFRNELSAMQKENDRLRIVYTLTECSEKIEGCFKGYIDDDLVRQEIQDYPERIFYSCGPPAMVDAMRKMLMNKLAVQEDRIITEDFIGY